MQTSTEPFVLVTPYKGGRLHYSEACGFWDAAPPAGSSAAWPRLCCGGAPAAGELRLPEVLRVLGVDPGIAQTTPASTRDEAARALQKNAALVQRYRRILREGAAERAGAEGSAPRAAPEVRDGGYYPDAEAAFAAPIPPRFCADVEALATAAIRAHARPDRDLERYLNTVREFTVDLRLHAPWGGDTAEARAAAERAGRVVVSNYALPAFEETPTPPEDETLVQEVLVHALLDSLADGASRASHRRLFEERAPGRGAALLDATYTYLARFRRITAK